MAHGLRRNPRWDFCGEFSESRLAFRGTTAQEHRVCGQDSAAGLHCRSEQADVRDVMLSAGIHASRNLDRYFGYLRYGDVVIANRFLKRDGQSAGMGERKLARIGSRAARDVGNLADGGFD